MNRKTVKDHGARVDGVKEVNGPLSAVVDGNMVPATVAYQPYVETIAVRAVDMPLGLASCCITSCGNDYLMCEG